MKEVAIVVGIVALILFVLWPTQWWIMDCAFHDGACERTLVDQFARGFTFAGHIVRSLW